MSKICERCGTTNYESASKCIRCGTAFSDGAYSIGSYKYSGGVHVKDQKKAIDKSSKLLILVITVILVLIATLVIVFITSNSSSKNDPEVADTPTVAADATVPNGWNKTSGDLTQPSNKGNIITGGKIGDGEDFGADYVAIDHIEVSQTEITLNVGDTFTLSGSVFPDNASNLDIYWTSNDESIATIDSADGTVTAVSEGVVNVFCVSVSEDAYSYCTVTVVEDYEPDETEDYGTFIVNANDYLSLRKGPGVDKTEIKRLDYGTEVQVWAYENDSNNNVWAYVSDGISYGWVSNRYLVPDYQFAEE